MEAAGTIPDDDARLAAARRRYAEANPRSRAARDHAAAWLPGGNTRSVLHHEPFPLTIRSGAGAYVTDLDGHVYLDCVGEFSAGLYGHSEPAIHEAVAAAMAEGITLGGPNRWEARLAQAVCERFATIERLRFCNSGTEANLLALVTARAVTGRDKVVVFDGAYHGGVLTFAGGGSPMNAPFPWVVLPYNDPETLAATLAHAGGEIAAVLVEPVLGAAGNIPGEADFLRRLREETQRHGCLLIFDEVKTARCGPAGVQGQLGLRPDLTTLGKYLGGGLPLAAFGGAAEIMERFDPRRADALKHAGTFNNNVLSMAAGLAGLTRVFTVSRAEAFARDAAAFQADLNGRLAAAGLPVRASGAGSLLSLHYGARLPRRAAEVTARTQRLRALLHLACLERGVRLTGRGDVFLSLPMTPDDRTHLAETLTAAVAELLSAS